MTNFNKKFLLINGSAEKVLKDIPDNTFHTVVTSPPYWQQRDYFVDGQRGREETIEEYINNLVNICREVKRTLRKDGTFWLNIGDTSKKSGMKINLKSKNIIGVPWKVAFALQEDEWILRQEIIWCLSGGTKLYVRFPNRDASINIRDLSRSKIKNIKLWNGNKWTQLLKISISKQKGDEITINLRSGERIACTLEHKWPTQRGVVKAKDLKKGDIIEKCILPEPKECLFPHCLEDKDIGWLVGMYLAEGSKSRRNGKTKNIQISSHIKEIERYEKLKKITNDFGGKCTKHKTSKNGMTVNIHSSIIESIIDTYIGGKNAKTKHLKTVCWNRSNVFLKSLLKGYLEGDGHWDKKNNRWVLGFTRNYYLESDLRTICARLGYYITLKLSISKIKDKEYKTIRGQIRFIKSSHRNNKNENEIESIRSSDGGGRLFYYDISVKDKPNLFSLSSGILTHNSKTNPMPDGAKDRPTRSHEYIFLLTKSQKYFYDYYATLEDTSEQPGNIQTFGAKHQEGTFRQDQNRTFEHYGKRNKRSVWTTSVASYKGGHYATFNQKLIDPCIVAGTSEKGCCIKCSSPWKRILEKVKILADNKKGYEVKLLSRGWEPTCKCNIEETKPCLVLDPFSGMATTGLAAIDHFQNYVGIELNEKYLKESRKRLYGTELFIEEVKEIGEF